MNIDVIIPAYNESKRINRVLSAVKKSGIANEIIVVDDGSTDGTAESVKKFSGIKLICHPYNKGKTEALKTGFMNSKSELIIFLDADITNLCPSHLVKFACVCKDGDFDMVLADLEREAPLARAVGFTNAYTGQRGIKRSFLENYPGVFKVKGYLFEAAVNKIAFHGCKIGKVCFRGVGQTFKIEKKGISGLLKDLGMYLNIIKHLGIREFTHQLVFAKNLPLLYS